MPAPVIILELVPEDEVTLPVVAALAEETKAVKVKITEKIKTKSFFILHTPCFLT
ncbi:hypothetical protein Bateq7PJ16_2265 [Bacillus subtilis]|nr:hypothetical protein Bateq7PJ16_2265 [Bacillus subtilis]